MEMCRLLQEPCNKASLNTDLSIIDARDKIPKPLEQLNIGKTGGVYIPPFKLARMMKEVEDKSSVAYQRLTWDALRKSIQLNIGKTGPA
jgi:pre-mRNA-splicing factor CWC22